MDRDNDYRKITALYVDDDESIQALMGTYLAKHIDQIVFAKNGLEGLNYYNQNKDTIDLIITDILMPKMDGIEMIKQIREQNISIPIVIISVNDSNKLILDAIELKIDNYFLKPINKAKLQNYFQRLVEHIKDDKKKKLAEENIKKSKFIYQLIAASDYFWEYFMDKDKNYVYISPACKRITGYDAEDFYREPKLLLRITHPQYKQRAMKHFGGDGEKAETQPFTFVILCKDGTKKTIEHICQPVYGRTGNFLGRRGSNREILDNKIHYQTLQYMKTSDDNYKVFDEQDICFIEANRKKSIVYLSHESFEVGISLKEVEKTLRSNIFFKTSRSYIVNLKKVSQISQYSRNSLEISFSDCSAKALLSKQLLKDFQGLLGHKNYIKECMGGSE